MDISKYLIEAKLSPSANKPLYIQIADTIENLIKNHTFPTGVKLPPERELAKIFGVSRTTAINAYHLLEERQLTTTKIGSGTYVANMSKDTAAEPNIPWSHLFVPSPRNHMSSIIRDIVSTPIDNEYISLAAGMPDPKLYPIDIFKELFKHILDNCAPNDLGYISTFGYEPLRQTLANMLTHNGIISSLENILILSGSQQGLYLLSRCILEQGDYVVMESPTYIGAIQVFQALGVRILTLPSSDTYSLNLLEDFLVRYRPKVFYTIPTYNNPTGHIISKNNRQELLQLASRHRLVIIEDDPYSQLYYDDTPPPALKALDSYDGVVYLGTFSKILMPGLRLGYICGPTPLINRISLEKQYDDLHSNNFTQIALNSFIKEDYLAAHLSMVRKEYKKRRDIITKALHSLMNNEIYYSIPSGGFYLWCKTTSNLTSSKLLHEALKNGLFFVPGEAFYPVNGGDKNFRLSFASHDSDTLIKGVERLKQVMVKLNRKSKHTISSFGTTGKPIV